MMKTMKSCNGHSVCKKAPVGHHSPSSAAKISTTSGKSENEMKRSAYISKVKSGY